MIDYFLCLTNMAHSCLMVAEYLKASQKKGEDLDNIIDSDNSGWLFSGIEAGFDFYKTINLKLFSDLEPAMEQALSAITTPQQYDDYGDILNSLDFIKMMLDSCSANISDFCSNFDQEEKTRLNESVHDYLEDCCLSSVAMSVSAVESRLFKLMNIANPNNSQNLEKLTLGQLIGEYTKSPNDYGSCVPNRHNHLISLCNAYRILSVHPKGYPINQRMANTILNLAVEFLVDQETKPKPV